MVCLAPATLVQAESRFAASSQPGPVFSQAPLLAMDYR